MSKRPPKGHTEPLILVVTIALIFFLRFRSHLSDEVVAVEPDSTQVRLLLGVMTLWDKIERRHLIRHLYPLSLANASSAVASDVVRTVFVVGQPASDTARAILEFESRVYGDILILEGVNENMNSGKTYNFLKTLHDWQILYQDGGWTHVGKVDDDTWYIPMKIVSMLTCNVVGWYYQISSLHCMSFVHITRSTMVVKLCCKPHSTSGTIPGWPISSPPISWNGSQRRQYRGICPKGTKII